MFEVDKVKSLNELEMYVYQYVMQHESAVPYMRIRELADASHVSTSTVLRFCHKMGCDGYAEFRLMFKQYLGEKNENLTVLPDVQNEVIDFMRRYINGYFERSLDKAASIISAMDQIVFFGIGNSGCICEYGARCFTNIGKFSTAVSDPFYPFTQMSNIRQSAIIVLSVSGETPEVIKMMQYIKNAGCKIILITVSDRCTAASLADHTIAYYISQHNLDNHTHIDCTSQQPAVCLIEDLARRLHNRLAEKEE